LRVEKPIVPNRHTIFTQTLHVTQPPAAGFQLPEEQRQRFRNPTKRPVSLSPPLRPTSPGSVFDIRPLRAAQGAQADTSAAANGQRSPAGDEAQAAERGYGAHDLEALGVQRQQVDTAAEHGHAGNKQAAGPLVHARLRRQRRDDQRGDRVDQLVLWDGGVLVRLARVYIFTWPDGR
jgi:hypothetical protein